MASIFGHSIVAYAGAQVFRTQLPKSAIWLAVLCAWLPDADVIGFEYGIAYASQWGHRGFTHSIVFSACFGTLLACLCYRDKKTRVATSILFSLATLSHALLDMLTNGGLGVALWWPMSSERIFFPARPIMVSPLGASAFLGSWGLRVLLSELLWLGIPSILVIIWSRFRVKR
jgi:inner membrane protein